MEEKIKLNKQGYEDYLNLLEEKEKKLAELRMYKGKDAIYQGDNWHDNPILYQAELKELSLMKEISEMKYKLTNNIEIVENLGDEELVDIGDVVKVDIIYDVDDKEEEIYKLVATNPKSNAEIPEVSINSPVGSAMYHKKIGETVKYKVNDNTFTLQIKEKILFGLEQEDKSEKKKIK